MKQCGKDQRTQRLPKADAWMPWYTDVKDCAKQGNFLESLRGRARALHNALLAVGGNQLGPYPDPRSNAVFLEAKCTAAEVHDYFGDRAAAEEIVQGAEHLYARFHTMPAGRMPLEERKLMRAEVGLVVYYAQTIYRRHQYESAKTILLGCRERLDGVVRDTDLPCFGTLGKLYYFLGRTYRHLHPLEKAEEAFSDSIDFYYRRAVKKASQAAMMQASYRVAKSLGMGLGWINYSRGFYSTAIRHNIRPARAFLMFTHDELNKARLDLLEGAVARALAGHREKELRAAIALIERSNKIFDEYDHRFYSAKAAYELVLAHLYLRDFPRANGELERLNKLCQQTGDVRWGCYYLILLSRSTLEQGGGRPDENRRAYDAACKAIDTAEQQRQVICLVDALIARGRALLAQGRPGDARHDFQRALQVSVENESRGGVGNPKTEAACHLRLCQTYLRESGEAKARFHFNSWKEKEKSVEHAGIRELGREVEDELRTSCASDFLIPARTPVLNYRELVEELQKFLVKQAEQRLGAARQKDVAESLHITRQTLHEWRKTWANSGESLRKESSPPPDP